MKEPSAASILVLFFSIFVSPHRKRRPPPLQDYKVIIFGPGGGGVSVAMAAIHLLRLSPNTALRVLELLQEQPGSGISHCLIKPGPGPDASGGAVTGLAGRGPAETAQTLRSLYDPS